MFLPLNEWMHISCDVLHLSNTGENSYSGQTTGFPPFALQVKKSHLVGNVLT